MPKPKHKPENPIQLRAYIGLDKEGKVAIFVSQGELNPLGTRCQKGEKFPGTLEMWLAHPSWEGTQIVLEDMQGYFERQGKR